MKNFKDYQVIIGLALIAVSIIIASIIIHSSIVFLAKY